ncbi:response regulator [Geoalkalibacter sp.]|uniref:response regulator n=1 Tax=Geoalkalibacter sp. TaxID=3041440 RepID=UPI00272EE092|nr:response regulator [Geoalkalibacter sp.]
MTPEFDDDEIFFADEDPEGASTPERGTWKLLVVDDEELIHNATRIALEGYRFEDRGLLLLSAYNGREARDLLAAHPDIAIVLLDVVMESDDAGLKLARYIRETLDNQLMQIVLRTGQPGAAPEKQVIAQYDINDYREKTELTELRLFTTITTALRAHRNLLRIEKNRKGLELIIASTGQLFADQRLRNFTAGVLTQLQSVLNLEEGSLLAQISGFAATSERGGLQVLAGTGDFQAYVGRPLEQVVSPDIRRSIDEALRLQRSIFTENAYIGYFLTENRSVNLLYLHGCRELDSLEKDLIRTFSSNIAIAFDKVFLTQEIYDTQREVIETLGSIVESRSNETANHVRRVAEFSSLLAQKAGIGERQVNLLKQAAFMHDVGKIGVPDGVLNKPGKLDDEEYAQVKNHTSLGHAILKNSKRDILQTAAIVAQQHHERWDGNGYPLGLAGEDIHIYGRIIALADVFDALINERVYRAALPLPEVIAILREGRGTQFDPHLTDIFLNHIDEFVELNEIWAD